MAKRYHSQENFLKKKNIFSKVGEKARAFIFRLKQGFVKIIKRPFHQKKKVKKHPNFV